jgi:hypothetical protein
MDSLPVTRQQIHRVEFAFQTFAIVAFKLTWASRQFFQTQAHATFVYDKREGLPC